MQDEYKAAWSEAGAGDDGLTMVNAEQGMTKESTDMAREFNGEPKTEQAPQKPVFKKFSEAFKYHRAKGDKTFEWNGKTYTTELKAEGPKKPKAAPVAMGNEGRREATANVKPAGLGLFRSLQQVQEANRKGA